MEYLQQLIPSTVDTQRCTQILNNFDKIQFQTKLFAGDSCHCLIKQFSSYSTFTSIAVFIIYYFMIRGLVIIWGGAHWI